MLSSTKDRVSKGSKNRSKSVFFLLALFGLLILIRFGFLMLKDVEYSDFSIIPPKVSRGSILDVKGNVLAIETEFYSIAVWTPYLESARQVAEELAPLIEEDVESLYLELTKPRSGRYFFLRRKLSGVTIASVNEALQRGELKGIVVEPEYGRVYPMGKSGSHLLGYVNIDNHGQDGIEYTYNSLLSPVNWAEGTRRSYGNDVRLTIDSNVQFMVEFALQKVMDEHSPDFIIGLVADAKNGEIRAYAQLPNFDLNRAGEYPEEIRRNQIATFIYEPGSVFKIFSMAALLDQGTIPEGIIIDTSQSYNPPIFRKLGIAAITDLNNYGKLSLEEILVHSSNVGMAYLSENITEEAFYQKLLDFGFGTPPSLPLLGETSGLLRPPSTWSLRTKPTMVFGQELGVTALQMLQASTVIANKGKMLKLHVIKEVRSMDQGVIQESVPTVLREVVSEKTATSLLKKMQQVVENNAGTARRLRIDGVDISAKSGTAQVYDPETGTYSTENFLGSLISIFPTDDPELILYLVMNNPKGPNTYGGKILSPIMRGLILNLIPYYGIKNEISPKIAITDTIEISPKREPVQREQTLDLSGYSKRELLAYAQRVGVNLTVVGSGWVIYQFPPPETDITPGMNLYVELRER